MEFSDRRKCRLYTCLSVTDQHLLIADSLKRLVPVVELTVCWQPIAQHHHQCDICAGRQIIFDVLPARTDVAIVFIPLRLVQHTVNSIHGNG